MNQGTIHSINEGLTFAGIPVVFGALILDLFMTFKYRDRTPYYWLIVTPFYGIRSIFSIVDGQTPIAELFFMIWGILILHHWWKNRPPKNRKKAEASSKVKVLAGKLVVVPVRG